MSLLTDISGPIREAALEGLASLPFPLPVGPICQLLRDPDKAVRRQASVLLTQQKDPQTVPYLFDVLQDPSQEVNMVLWNSCPWWEIRRASRLR